MGGGPGGTGAGVNSGSLAWAIVMSAFAGMYPESFNPLFFSFSFFIKLLVVFFLGEYDLYLSAVLP